MLYVSFLHHRCERSLNARIGPSPDCNVGGEKFDHSSYMEMAPQWQTRPLWRSSPVRAPTETERGQAVTMILASTQLKTKATRVCLRHEA